MLRLQFKTFRSYVAFVFLSLVAIVLATGYFVVVSANRSASIGQIDENLRTGARVFDALSNRQIDQLMVQARLLSYDYGFKQAFGTSSDDPATMRLALLNWRNRINASFLALVSLDGQVIHDSEHAERIGKPFAIPALIEAAQNSDQQEARGLAMYTAISSRS